MRLLLDTHALIWWFVDRDSLSRPAWNAIADEANAVFVSAASAVEITTKHRIGKLPQAAVLIGDLETHLAAQLFEELPVRLRHGSLAGNLQGPHRDPFDRMLAAQAVLEGLTLVSSDAALDQFGVRRLW